MPSKEQINAIIKEARKWLGTPYHAHAQVKGHGVDCAQLLLGVTIAAGVIDPVQVRQDYSTVVPEGTEYTDTILKYCDEITEAEAGPGDLALYKTPHGWMHSAIVIEWPCAIVHATEKRGVVMTHGTEDFLKGRPRRFFRLKS